MNKQSKEEVKEVMEGLKKVTETLEGFKTQLENLGGDEQDKLDSMSEKAQEGEKGETAAANVDQLGEGQSEVEEAVSCITDTVDHLSNAAGALEDVA